MDKNDIETIIKEYCLKEGINVKTIKFYGRKHDWVNRDDYNDGDGFSIKNIICE